MTLRNQPTLMYLIRSIRAGNEDTVRIHIRSFLDEEVIRQKDTPEQVEKNTHLTKTILGQVLHHLREKPEDFDLPKSEMDESTRAKIYLAIIEEFGEKKLTHLLNNDDDRLKNGADAFDDIMSFAVREFSLENVIRIERAFKKAAHPAEFARDKMYGAGCFNLVFETPAKDKIEFVEQAYLSTKTADRATMIVRTKIRHACEPLASDGNTEALEYLFDLSERYGIETVFRFQLDALVCRAAEKEHFDTARWLVAKGGNPAAGGNAALMKAVEIGDLEMTKHFFPLSTEKRSYLPMLTAVQFERTEIIEWLTPLTDFNALRTKIPPGRKKMFQLAQKIVALHDAETLINKHSDKSIGNRKASTGL